MRKPSNRRPVRSANARPPQATAPPAARPRNVLVDDSEEETPAMPSQVVSSGTSLDLSGSVYETSSGSNMDASQGPARAFGPQQEGTVNMLRWEQFIQQNNLVVNIDPNMVETYVQARLDAERSCVAALAHMNPGASRSSYHRRTNAGKGRKCSRTRQGSATD